MNPIKPYWQEIFLHGDNRRYPAEQQRRPGDLFVAKLGGSPKEVCFAEITGTEGITVEKIIVQ
jgi:hypothetical protein